jgi:hypothetical protein
VSPDERNAKKIYCALAEFGAPLKNAGVDEIFFTKKKMIYQLGLEPVRADFLMGIEGLDFASCWRRRKRIKYGNVSVNLIGLNDLIKAKKISKRKVDKIDLEILKKVQSKNREKR